MRRLKEGVIQFLKGEGFVIVSTLDKEGIPHSSCKGIVKIKPQGIIYLLDLYQGKTFDNLKRNSRICITAVDEHRFKGYCLKGKAKIIPAQDLSDDILKAWEERINSRISQRMIKNIRGEKGHHRHPEILLPKPEYMIMVKVKEIVDLTPQHIKQKE